MTASLTGIVKVMDGLLLYHTYQEPQSPITTLMKKQDVSEDWIFLLGFLTINGFQHIWQIRLDCMGNLKGASVM
jgi:hypothetical protein